MNLTLDQIIALYDHPATRPYMQEFLTRQGITPPSQGSAIRSADKDSIDWFHDAASEALINEAPVVESFETEMDKGVFPIQIQGVEGAYVVRAQEFDDSAPMATLAEARFPVESEFGEFLVRDDGAGSGESSADACPYCRSNDGCEHFLLLLDLTFRQAQGGPLYEDFDARWSAVQEQGEDDESFYEPEAFQECIEEVDQVAGYGAEFDFEGGPGQSSFCQIWYLSSKEEVAAAVEAYRRLIGA